MSGSCLHVQSDFLVNKKLIIIIKSIDKSGVIWEKHGAIAYSTALFLCCSWWQRQFGQAEACPNCVFEDFTLNSVNPLKGSSIVRLFAQALAAFLVVKYVFFKEKGVHA